MSPRINAANAVRIKSDVRQAADGSLEQLALSVLLFLLYMAYAALGRDVFYNHSYDPPGTPFVDPISSSLPHIRVFLCVVTIVLVVARTDLQWALSKIAWLFAPFCMLALISTSWAYDSANTLRDAAMLIMLWLAMSMLVHRIGLVQAVKVSIHLLAAVCIASCFLALFFPKIGVHDGLETVQSVHKGRWRGIFSHKNGLGPWAAYGSVFLFTHSWLCGGYRLYWWLARASAVACLIFAGSATNIVLTAALLLFYGFFRMLERMKLATTLAISAGVVTFLGFFYVLNGDVIFELLGRDSSLTGRTQIWASAIDFFWTSPWVGNGFQSLGGPGFLGREQILFGESPGPESGYFTLLLELGFLGAVFFFVPYLIAIKNGFEWLKHVRAADRASLEFFLMQLISTLVIAVSESNILISTGFDGVILFAACFALMTTPKSPDGVLRGEFRLAKYRLPPVTKRNRPRRPASQAAAPQTGGGR